MYSLPGSPTRSKWPSTTLPHSRWIFERLVFPFFCASHVASSNHSHQRSQFLRNIPWMCGQKLFTIFDRLKVISSPSISVQNFSYSFFICSSSVAGEFESSVDVGGLNRRGLMKKFANHTRMLRFRIRFEAAAINSRNDHYRLQLGIDQQVHAAKITKIDRGTAPTDKTFVSSFEF